MNKQISVLGHDINIAPKQEQQNEAVREIGKKEVQKATELLRKYKDGKASIEARIIENEKWFKMRHMDTVDTNATKDGARAASAWLFNSLANKHADAMDNYPEPNVLPREKADSEEAKILSKIIPLVMEHNDFEDTYSDAWWYKVKHGGSAYGTFWNTDLENGLGDIDIKKIDVLNLFWEPGISKLQDSANLFIVELVDKDTLNAQYPEHEGKLDSKVIDVAVHLSDDTIDTTDKVLVVDWYYKTKVGTKTLLQYVKYVGDTVLYASENETEVPTDEMGNPIPGKIALADRGYYDHGEYPVELDVLFPVEGSPFGFGYIDVMREPQLEIDKLGGIIIKNAAMIGNKRWFVKENANINETEFADFSKPFVHVVGSLEDKNIMEIKYEALPAFITTHQQSKIEELKETSGNRDFSQGSTAGGVTSGAAIAALQEAGSKGARDMIKGSYRTYSRIVYRCIELIRQFYDVERQFRITGDNGETDFVDYSNKNLAPQEMQAAYMGADQQEGYEKPFRKPIFDIRIKAQKSNPYSRLAQNELAKEFYGAGFFDPMRADQALIAIEMMDFEGKQTVVEKISKNQQLLQQIQQMNERMAQMAQVIQQVTGAPTADLMQQEQAQQGGKLQGAQRGAMQDTRKPQDKSYGERLADRATPQIK